LRQIEACLYSNNQAISTKKELIDQLVFRMESVLRAKKYDYILFNIPNDKINAASQILPGLKSPTVVPLLEQNWSSMHSVIQKNKFWEIINQLKTIGAEGILVSPLSKMVF